MTPEAIIAAIERDCRDVESEANVVRFNYEDVPLMLVYDENADRMRLISPVVAVDDLEEGMIMRAMEANFHSMLDVRYAVANGLVWSAFMHPMSDLSPELFRSAIRQVATARETFGGDYSSGAWIFRGI